MSVIRVIFSIFNFLLFIHAAYFAVFGIWGLFRKRQVFADTEERMHFAALIPARNEEAVIGNLVDILPLVMLLSIITSLLAYFVMQVPVNPVVFFLGVALSFWIGMSISCFVAMLKSGSSIRDNIKGIIAFPVFILTWAPILVSCFFRRSVEWTPIKHDKSISIDEVKKAEHSEEHSAD